jgi:hypothetical protein
MQTLALPNPQTFSLFLTNIGILTENRIQSPFFESGFSMLSNARAAAFYRVLILHTVKKSDKNFAQNAFFQKHFARFYLLFNRCLV